MFKNHLEMIGRNESPSKKAKFWQSYIRSLKGSEDIRAHETPRANRPYSSYLDGPGAYRSIYEEPATTAERVQSSGYRYLPVSRDTYGYSPRAIYDHHYSRTIPANYEAEKAWNDHLKRMQEIERKYPSRWGLYLREKPSTTTPVVPLEYEPEDKLISELNKANSNRLLNNGYNSQMSTSQIQSKLQAYMSAAETFAKQQALRTLSGMYSNTNADNFKEVNNIHASESSADHTDGSRYKTKTWEKASKWTSQSEIGSDGNVNNYKELSTGESENYNINGRQVGYQAATATIEDNGKLSTYSQHT